MGMSKADFFANDDVFIEYEFEDVMFRWDAKEKKIYRKFKDEDVEHEVPHDSKLFSDATLFGDRITKEKYYSR